MENNIPVGNEEKVLKWIWKNLVPKSGQAKTVQGELLRCSESLCWEAQNNGNINWDDSFEIMVSFLRDILDDGDLQFKKDIKRISNFKSPNEINSKEELEEFGPYTNDDLYDRINQKIYEYVKSNPELILREINPKLYR